MAPCDPLECKSVRMFPSGHPSAFKAGFPTILPDRRCPETGVMRLCEAGSATWIPNAGSPPARAGGIHRIRPAGRGGSEIWRLRFLFRAFRLRKRIDRFSPPPSSPDAISAMFFTQLLNPAPIPGIRKIVGPCAHWTFLPFEGGIASRWRISDPHETQTQFCRSCRLETSHLHIYES